MKDYKNFNWNFMQDKFRDVLGDDFWGDMNSIITRQGPSIDVFKTDKEIIVLADLPGVKPSDSINIKLKGLKLYISGTIPSSYSSSEEGFIKKERFTGNFSREIQLPPDITPKELMEAFLKNGVLEIHIPIANDESEKEIFVDYRE